MHRTSCAFATLPAWAPPLPLAAQAVALLLRGVRLPASGKKRTVWQCGGARGLRPRAGPPHAPRQASLAGDRKRGKAVTATSRSPRSSRNHPHRSLVNDDVDCRETPQPFFDEQHLLWGFTIDAAANDQNHKLPRYWTIVDDALTQSWSRERVWCNPPFSRLRAWVLKAISEVLYNDCEVVVMLLPANRTEQPWWQDLIEPSRDLPGSGIATRFIRGRLRFGAKAVGPDAATPNENRPPFGCVLVMFTPQVLRSI
jgi:phage N-6-adenine-methyltransferase